MDAGAESSRRIEPRRCGWRLRRAVSLSLLLVLACAAPAAASNVYVSNSGSDSVSLFDVGPGGALSPKSPRTVAAGDLPDGVAVSPDGESLYAANVGSNSISQYDIGPRGTLTAKVPATVGANGYPDDVAVSPDGESAYVADVGNISQFDVGPGGVLSPKSPATVASGVFPDEVVVSPDGKSVYVASAGFDVAPGSVSQYDVGPGGELSPKPIKEVYAGNPPNGIAVSLDGKSVYVANGGSDGEDSSDGVYQFDVGAGGELKPKSPPTVAAGRRPSAVAVSPNGKNAYVANGAGGDVSQFDILPDGTLSAKSPATVGAHRNPSALAFTPNGRSLYVANAGSANISQYDVGARGALTPKPTHTVAAPGGASDIVLRPTPREFTKLGFFGQGKAKPFRGNIHAGSPACRKHRKVNVFRKSGRLVGKTRSDRRGRWFIPKPHPHGEFYAKVTRERKRNSAGAVTYLCQRDSSEQRHFG
jgi:DNA-binding beta-propeller fold protein YncE